MRFSSSDDLSYKKRQNFKEKEKSCYKKSKNGFLAYAGSRFCFYFGA